MCSHALFRYVHCYQADVLMFVQCNNRLAPNVERSVSGSVDHFFYVVTTQKRVLLNGLFMFTNACGNRVHTNGPVSVAANRIDARSMTPAIDDAARASIRRAAAVRIWWWIAIRRISQHTLLTVEVYFRTLEEWKSWIVFANISCFQLQVTH